MQWVDDHFSLTYFTLFVGCLEFNQTCLPYHPSRPSGSLLCRCSLQPRCFLCFRRHRNGRHRKPLTVMTFDDLKWLKKTRDLHLHRADLEVPYFSCQSGPTSRDKRPTYSPTFFLLLYGLLIRAVLFRQWKLFTHVSRLCGFYFLLQRDEIIRWLRDVYGNQVSGVGNGAIFSTCFSPTYGNDKTYLKQGAGNGPTSAIRANGSPDLGAIVIDASGASVQQKKQKNSISAPFTAWPYFQTALSSVVQVYIFIGVPHSSNSLVGETNGNMT